ncbi:helix-turn-helix domain-containing protein [Holzapfeliella floricola]|uniref:HTH cro/C1-type domain-containing protein n=1 Tax=Holzapfeliella floricola DSM 23037 = JCM 16512 TaxID=1423744 RepID=A0A0R2DVR9_9LACO|nr:helix-turn-helix domain-containing protein [Holzapfeliella floricola]KRN04716.1 hypothetical protein FC86_GL001072 [Holzapfeliella floricola DSM 23037 = JCM 16512]
MDVADRLKTIRQQRKWSQEELAKKLYVTRQTISRWETGTREPTLSALKDIAEVYQISLEELLGGELVMKKKELNWFAILGLVIFNVAFLGTVGILVGLVLFSLYFIGTMSLISTIGLIQQLLFPSPNQTIDMAIKYPWSIALLPIIGVLLLVAAVYVTKFLMRYGYKYFKYSMSKSFYEVK